ncbi:branched-chain amino acid ABC transporter permease [Streptomyces sp. HNM0663]|uniref:Branched-chain amino acid ABC transporter permease n=1 Tax=Streptomyces chengmaiensis TaxID=3040919 RepID=A0ABT6HPB1_9ACTN|nr:branched-chain amino acid ABC transporter permease [Streptomyces chengmaiensis]MDH2390548.1 branched-chain amino acid ABC transporter permease [Streptomyces chengmaiensis]
MLLLLAPPFYVSSFWLQTGLFAMAAVIGAIGLNLLSGTTGQLSLGHAFFLAVGAYGYVWLAADPSGAGSARLGGLGLPPLLAFVLAVVLAGAAGGLFSPISGRLRGMYLGIATLALVFLGHHVMLNAQEITGGFNGRSVPALEFLGFSFGDTSPDGLAVFGVPFGGLERLWYVGLALVAVAWLAARNILRGRPGRALAAVRDSEVAAAVMGVPLTRYRASAFIVSSMYAGAAGALLALVFKRVVPDHFGLLLSIDYLAMIVIGGLGSVGGAAAGAVFVALIPQLLTKYADHLPLLTAPGAAGSGVTPGEAARYLYGAAIVVVLVFAPGGLAGLTHRLSRRSGDGTRPIRRFPLRTHRTTSGPQGVEGTTPKEHTQ